MITYTGKNMGWLNAPTQLIMVEHGSVDGSQIPRTN